MQLDVVENISEREFVSEYVAKNKPVVVKGIPFAPEHWTPDALRETIGHLTSQVYNTLFDLEDILSLSEYLDEYFGHDGPYRDDVPYVRWYNQLKDVDFVWGDEAFDLLKTYWGKPACVPDSNLIIPMTANNGPADPVTDSFPYRGILVAARGARTRLHRDPFCTDAIVAQFYGTKEAVLYHPSRANELLADSDGSSFGGFVDVREADLSALSHEPDYRGQIGPGEMIYIPHGWLHDVLVLNDSVSVTWNFVHEKGVGELKDYLRANPEDDSEFEVLQYFYAQAGFQDMSSEQILAQIS